MIYQTYKDLVPAPWFMQRMIAAHLVIPPQPAAPAPSTKRGECHENVTRAVSEYLALDRPLFGDMARIARENHTSATAMRMRLVRMHVRGQINHLPAKPFRPQRHRAIIPNGR